jgi:hypothetical protein
MRTAEPLISEPSIFEVETPIQKMKRYKSPGFEQIPAQLIQVGGKTLYVKRSTKLLMNLDPGRNSRAVEGVYYCTDL